MRGLEVIVSYDFRLDSIKKPVLTDIPPVFPQFLLLCLMDTLRVWYLWIGILKGHLSVKVSRRTEHFPSTTSAFTGTLSRIYHYPILLSFIRDFPFLDYPPSTIQVLKLSSIDAGSAGSGFEVKFYGFLVGFHRFGSFKYFGCLFYIDVLMWRYQSEVLGLYLAFISHVKIHFLYISCRMRICIVSTTQKYSPFLSCKTINPILKELLHYPDCGKTT